MKKCFILVNSFKKDAPLLAEQISAFLKVRDFDSFIFSYDGKEAENRDEEVSIDFSGYDLIITLGGDGTVLCACRGCSEYGIPVFAINLGEFGFLAGIQPASWKEELTEYLDGKSKIGERCLVEAEVIREGKSIFTLKGMNDVILAGEKSTKLINLNVAYNHAHLGHFKASGIIVATATGSTAYSAAEGGPIIDPSLDSMVFTPISSFSLSARPLVFNSTGEIAVTIIPSRTDVILTVDGQIQRDLLPGDVVIIGVSEKRAKLIGATQEKFYSALQCKLNWSGGPRA